MFLPLISPHKLQQGFKVGDGDPVFIIMRTSYFRLKNEVDSLDTEHSGIYVRGPVGVGKSYLEYLLVAEYRLDRNSHRVTYINDCVMWTYDKFSYILRELVTTFYDDTIEGKSIVEWCQAVTGSDKEEKMMMMMMESLITYVQVNKLQWIVICDQHNAFYARSVVVEQFPFNLIDTLADYRGANIKVIISASANNEGYPTKMEGWITHDISSHRFDEDEFQEWCKHYRLEDNVQVDPASEEAVDAL